MSDREALDALVGEVHDRLAQVVRTRDRLLGLLEAVLAVAAGLELDATLRRIVQAGTELIEARYGALAVVGEESLIGDPIGLPPHDPGAVLDAPILVGDEVFGTIYLAEKRGAAGFTPDDRAVLTALAAAAGVAVENARRFEWSRTRERWLAANAEINERLLYGASTQETLNLVAARTRELTGADCVLVLLPEPDKAAGTGLVITAAVGEWSAELARERIGAGWAELLDGADDLGGLLPVGEFGPALAVRLPAVDGAGALLAVRAKGRPRFAADLRPMLATLANQAAMALEFAETQRARRLLDVLADRDRIAGDLHDHVIQRLFATGMSLQGTVRRITDQEAAHRVTRAVEELDATVREIRTSIFDLHTTGEDRAASLRRRLLDTVAECAAGTAVAPAVRISGPVDTLVPDEIGDHVVAVLRAVVGAALRLGRAGEVTITVEAGRELVLVIVDNGAVPSPEVVRAVRAAATECDGTATLDRITGGQNRLVWHATLPMM